MLAFGGSPDGAAFSDASYFLSVDVQSIGGFTPAVVYLGGDDERIDASGISYGDTPGFRQCRESSVVRNHGRVKVERVPAVAEQDCGLLLRLSSGLRFRHVYRNKAGRHTERNRVGIKGRTSAADDLILGARRKHDRNRGHRADCMERASVHSHSSVFRTARLFAVAGGIFF